MYISSFRVEKRVPYACGISTWAAWTQQGIETCPATRPAFTRTSLLPCCTDSGSEYRLHNMDSEKSKKVAGSLE